MCERQTLAICRARRFDRVGHAIGCGFSRGFPGKVATEPASCGALVTRAIAPEDEYSDGDREGTVAEANNRTRREGSHSSDKIPDRRVFVCMGCKSKTVTRVWRPPMQLSGGSSQMKSTRNRSVCRGSRTPPQRVTSTSDSACKDGLAGGGSCRGGTRRDCGCR